jgi:hypothetical protein
MDCPEPNRHLLLPYQHARRKIRNGTTCRNVVERGLDMRINGTVRENRDWVAGLEGEAVRILKRPRVWAEVEAMRSFTAT